MLMQLTNHCGETMCVIVEREEDEEAVRAFARRFGLQCEVDPATADAAA